MLVLDNEYNIAYEIKLDTIKKHTVTVNSLDELRALKVNEGDQVRITYNLPVNELDRYAEISRSLEGWGKEAGVQIVGADIVSDAPVASRDLDPDISPSQLLDDFAAAEEIDDSLLQIGQDLLKEVLS